MLFLKTYSHFFVFIEHLYRLTYLYKCVAWWIWCPRRLSSNIIKMENLS